MPASTRSAHLDVRLLAVVFLGGACGTAARASLETAFAAPVGAWPWPTFVINVTGALALGFLLELLARRGPDGGLRRVLRLGLGTGLLGGFTTFSTLAVETLHLSAPLALCYAAGSIVLGALAAGVGYLLARRVPAGMRPRREPPAPATEVAG
ncbi:CrcB family protein [Mobilicoccus massiliensis]|uniref:CrcB family protein n=1 Tax=Mobilicoccus massiliensis TaxID=1522310 RepID=UPI0006937327|nr:CrcB family protein [Mobilicoccus massiliensis]